MALFRCCKSSSQVAVEIRDREIDSKNAADADREAQRVKLLLLGAGESGKSTLLKQFRLLYGPGFPEEERRALLPVVHANTLSSIGALLSYVQENGWALPPALRPAAERVAAARDAGLGMGGACAIAGALLIAPGAGGGVTPSPTPAAAAVAAGAAGSGTISPEGTGAAAPAAAADAAVTVAVGTGAAASASAPEGAGAGAAAALPASGGAIDEATGQAIAALWASEPIKRAYAERARFQLLDSAGYWLDHVATTAAAGYVPSVEDVLRIRVRTSGILEERYAIDGVDYTIYDVGGQRNERRKWMHCFEDVTAIIFVAAISEYDQTLYEENTANRLVEAIDLFGKVIASRHFEHTSIVLFLNKRDLFETKIKSVDLRGPNPDPFAAEREPVLFADYDGGCDYEKALRYVLGKFLAQNTNPRKEIFYRVTVATDPDNVRTVFAAAREIILRQNLINSGLMEA